MGSYITVMRKIGIPVDRELACSRLPPRIEETPDLFVSLPLALEWIAHCGSDVHPMQLGFLASQETSLRLLKPTHLSNIMAAPTGLKRLQAVAALAHREDSALRLSMRPEAGGVRLFIDFAQLGHHPFLCLADWLAVQSILSIVRSVAGPHWRPREISFVSKYPLPLAAQEVFGKTRMLVGQARTSILIESKLLIQTHWKPATDTNAAQTPLLAHDLDVDPWTFTTLLRAAIQPYLNGGRPDLEMVAEVICMSKRSLQRRLQLSGHSYSRILQDARCELAKALLDDSNAKIIDVALMSGYESPQHFSRAFRRFTGFTPTAYRRISMMVE